MPKIREMLLNLEGSKYASSLYMYADFNKHFDVHTGASNHQLKAGIIQEAKPIAFYIRKLT